MGETETGRRWLYNTARAVCLLDNYGYSYTHGVFPFSKQWLCERISILLCTYLAFHVGKQDFVIGDTN
jgi:hypothetical protein